MHKGMKITKAAPLYADKYIAILDENDNEVCRVYPVLHEPNRDFLARAQGIAVILDFGYDAAAKHALDVKLRDAP